MSNTPYPLPHQLVISRKLATIPGSFFTTSSTSACVVSVPSVSRSEPFASSRVKPIAVSTWLGSRLPAVHAEPLDAAMPS